MDNFEKLKTEQNVPVIMIDHDGIINYINHAFEKVFQWSKKEIIGQPVTVIIPKELHNAHHLGFSRFLSTEQGNLIGTPLELAAIKKDGTQFNAEHTIYAKKKNDHWVFAATICILEDRKT